MSVDALARLQRRARQVRANAVVRRWEYRQRHHARGVWFRLRRLLAEAKGAWRVPQAEAFRFMSEGYAAEPVGQELEPPLVLVFIPEERLLTIESRSPVGLRLGADLLRARFLALVRFPEAAGRS